jgi:adenosylcobinamide-phosphate synthase
MTGAVAWLESPELAAVGAVALAALLDATVAEVPGRVHPVALFGRVVGRVDRAWRRPRLVGAVAALALPVGAAGLAALVVLLADAIGRTIGVSTGGSASLAVGLAGVAAGGVLFATTSLRMLLSAAGRVIDATAAGDRATARTALRALVGRDTADLAPGEVRSAAVESLGENLADGLVAPLAGVLVGAAVAAEVGAAGIEPLAVGAGGAAWVKAVNTMDSMLGYRSKPVGWAAARLDDVVMYLPARASAVLVAVAGRSPTALRWAHTSAGTPPSPNSGWPMATLAAVLSVRLVKPGAYDLRPIPGATLPTVGDGRRAIRVVAIAGTLTWVATALGLLVVL